MTTLSGGFVTSRVDQRHWRVLLGALHATFRTGSFVGGLDFVTRITAAAEAANHHPDVDLRYPAVHLRLVSHDVGGLTERDIALATEISSIADALGLDADVGSLQVLEVAIDALDIPRVMAFWRALLGYDERAVEPEGPPVDLVDPQGRAVALWFQQMGEPRTQRNRIHLDVSVPHDAAAARIEAALAAGGALVTDRFAPAWWVLADPEGNEACVSTWQGRADAG